MKKGFSLLTAIMFIVLIATIGALALSFSTQTSKQTSDVYLRAQAEILARSATEYALLALSAHNHTANCLETIEAEYNDIFDINMTLYYIGNFDPTWTCGNVIANDIATADSNLTVIIDTYVQIKDNITSEDIRIHRRTLQKP